LILACSGGPPVTTGGETLAVTAAAPDGSVAAAPSEPAPAAGSQQACRAHGECPSGVCSHFKKDNGYCAPERCAPGERADNNQFYCDRAGSWVRSRREGEPCEQSYECYESTCFMNPMCDLHPPDRAECRDGACVRVPVESDCATGGGQLVLACEEFMEGCVESLAQRVLRTVCVPCGNGVCDAEECPCNCPADCPR
jgi:hypothetical protein